MGEMGLGEREAIVTEEFWIREWPKHCFRKINGMVL